MSLVCDAVLDVVSSIGVSFTIFATYAPQYTDPIHGFPFSNWFDDVWFTNMQQEFQMMLVVSWADMANRLVFALGLLQCMEMIKDLLTPVETKSISVGVLRRIPIHASKEETRQSTLVTGSSKRKLSTWKGTLRSLQKPISRRFSRVEKVGPWLFGILGFVVFIIHIVSETRTLSVDVPCRLRLHPWFVTKPSCSLVEFDCHQLGGLSGSRESLHNAWNTFQFDATARIFVRHCPQLEFPSTIQHYRQITAIKTYNCTITSWAEDAALTTTTHPHLCSIFGIRTEIPKGKLLPGLLTADFPVGFKAFILSVTNLHTLPENLHELWPPGMAMSLEHSALYVAPPVLLKMATSVLSFSGCPLSQRSHPSTLRFQGSLLSV